MKLNNFWRKSILAVALLAMPLGLASMCYATYPFAETIATKTLSLSSLTGTQKSNIQLAAHAIDGTILKPGESFSFNEVVGPRGSGRGYRPAPSYLGPDNPATIGGGVCLVSSAVYQLALETGCKIDERVAHLRTIRTVPAGLDATVWYGQADLKFHNSLSCPVQFKTKWDNTTLTVSMLGRIPSDYEPAKINVVLDRKAGRDVVVELFRRRGDKEELVSRDRYAIN
jgi:vancomycin resistance protein VanW